MPENELRKMMPLVLIPHHVSVDKITKHSAAIIAETEQLVKINAFLISALRQCWEFIDDIADGAPDAGYSPRRANELWATVKDALERAGERTDHHD